MRLRHLSAIIVFCLGPGLTTIQAQESMNTAGNNLSASTGSVSFSVGQVFYTTYHSLSGSSMAGVQHPLEVSVVTGIGVFNASKIQISAYPNPTTDELTLSLTEFDPSNASYLLYSLDRRIVQQEKLTGNTTSINLIDQIPGTYLLKVLDGGNELITFKIIKY